MFKLDFSVPPLPRGLSLDTPILLVGSCFSEHIGAKLAASKFRSLSNPFGTIYNPISIFKLLRSDAQSISSSYFEQDGIHYSWDTHSALSDSDESSLREKVSRAFEVTKPHLEPGSWIIVSPGTAWAYELLEDGRLVANCHRYPQQSFRKRLLSANEIMDSFEKTRVVVGSDIHWLFTVSPVRHIRDGLVENNRSKAILLDAVHRMVEAHDNCHYFPAYEIVTDELRDYRFFDRDLVHPNALAIDYVWGKFVESCLDEGAREFVKVWFSIAQDLQHRPRHPESAAHQKFLRATILKLKRLENKVDITKELARLQSQLNE